MNSFFLGFEKKAAEVVYHGSSAKVKVLKPRNIHGNPRSGDILFASPHAGMSLAYTGKKYGDADIHQSYYYKDGKKVFTLEEMRPGALDETYKGRKGYLYTLPADKFKTDPEWRFGGGLISSEKVTPYRTEVIADIPKRLKEEGVVLKKFNPSSPTRQTKVKRMREMVESMAPDWRREYLDWVGETNPELKKELLK